MRQRFAVVCPLALGTDSDAVRQQVQAGPHLRPMMAGPRLRSLTRTAAKLDG
jgi:hypothetical protein